MAGVYSKRFLVSSGVLGTGDSYEVPPGFVAVVRQLSFYASSGAFNITAFFEHEPSGAALDEESWSTTDAQSYLRDVRFVFAQGEGFHFQVDTAGTAGVDVYAGGYLLAQ